MFESPTPGRHLIVEGASSSSSISAKESVRLGRLQALAVLDSVPEAFFDSLAQAASRLCDTPIGLVSLVDAERQWFKANVGLPGVVQIPRESSFCGYAIGQTEVIAVQDARLDARFAANPLVTGTPGIRFYAGAPIVLSDGLVMGTLCVMGQEPRQLDIHQRNTLAALAHLAASALETREQALAMVKSADASRRRLDKLFLSAPAMLHSIDAQGHLIAVSEVWLAALGYRREEVLGRRSTEFLTAESAQRAIDMVLPAFLQDGRCDRVEYQMVCKNGSVLDVLLSAILERDAAGVVLSSMAIIEDVTGRKRAERELRDSEARYRALVEGQRELVSMSTREGVLSFVNGAYAQFFGQPAQALIGTRLLDQVSEEERPALADRLSRVFDLGQTSVGEDRLLDSEGRLHWIEWSNRPVIDEEGRVIGMHAVGRDISERRQVERRLAESRELLQVTLDSIGDGVITTDAEGLVQWLNPVAERLTGYSKAEAWGRPLAQIFQVVEEDGGQPAVHPVGQCLAHGQAVDRVDDKVLVSRDGVEYGITDSASPIRDAQGALLGAVLVFHDTTEQRRMSREISHRARHDALTGLFNRTEFELRLTRLLARTQHDAGRHALLFVDLDQFKLVNDACGHSAGDQLLRQVSALLQSSVRGRDSVARLGGDEFGLLLEHCELQDAQRLAQGICDRMETYRFEHDERRFRVGASIGLVPLDGSSLGTAAAMQAADISCYAAKEAGRNRVHLWFDTDLAMRARSGETKWATRIEQALDEDRFVLFAQRIEVVDNARQGTGGLHAEALLRMVDADGGLVLPGAFLPAAERFHLSSRIDRWVLRRACEWLLAQTDLTPIELLCINLSGRSIGDRVFHQHALEILATAGGAVCQRICLEVTETAAVTNLADAALFIEQVRRLGVRIALDDFGAGASSFGYLKTLVVDMLKIDGQFIRDLLDDPLDDVAVRCFVDVARVMGLKTVAEFVDRPELLQRLGEIGVDYAQGFLLHKPEPIDQLVGTAGETSPAAVR